ncbi:MerR family transcriptional regulator [Deinococcus metallilatus]|uniref:DNA-binding transcriptional MerR regulator n=1 Tax=Deinococcus metallilatus TaxID=1211322 RepID=A0AAE5YQY9_9DEIO|nr:MerR family transcriptional regulator [Deinococcus metallilatus]MBB5294710.1 DNA-binding transcriptional MerR regulator [Deinococcus metallilatus]QBY07739.1 MerR family transcriptional regulator [Deinococcus metallilatus]RXJ14155.1 MerR family transcriptional regulator [Deinococcus metallilatus]TLK30120.1 MerR family transcriptional regulator [Deinococcus metallilatus]GMA15927.1 MerR family transcriptional regulator [Deinococcus metallilatus]
MTGPAVPDATPRYRVGEVAARLGLTLRTLKYYEELGLVTPQRSGSRYRLYSEADVERLERVRRMRALGLSLETIRATFTQPQERDPEGRQVLTPEALRALEADLSGQLEVLTQRITAAERELRDARALRRDLERDLTYVRRRLSGARVGDLLREADPPR